MTPYASPLLIAAIAYEWNSRDEDSRWRELEIGLPHSSSRQLIRTGEVMDDGNIAKANSRMSRRSAGVALAGAVAGIVGAAALPEHDVAHAAASGNGSVPAASLDSATLVNMTAIPPSGDSTGATDAANINSALAAGQAVQLLAAPLSAPYYINSPIILQSQSRLWGAQWAFASNEDSYSAGIGGSVGTVIVMTDTFSGDGAISMPDPGDTQMYGVDLAGFTIEGYEAPRGGDTPIYGIHAVGAWGAVFLRGVMVHRTPSDCFRMELSAVSDKIPDEWIVDKCKASASVAGYGFYLHDCADSVFTDCNSSENQLDNWFVNYGVNTRLNDCKGENSKAGNGFHFTGIAAGEWLGVNGCTTHLNYLNGFLLDNDGPSGGGLGLYTLTGCVSQADGVAGDQAAFSVQDCNSRVMLTGCVGQLVSTGSYPAYGLASTGSFGAAATGSLLQGATAVVYNGGGNTNAPVNQAPYPF
jgi:hypothetical protein